MFTFIEELMHRGRDQCPEVFFCWGLATSKNLFAIKFLERAIQDIGLKVCISFSREDSSVVVDNGKIRVVEGRKVVAFSLPGAYRLFVQETDLIWMWFRSYLFLWVHGYHLSV